MDYDLGNPAWSCQTKEAANSRSKFTLRSGKVRISEIITVPSPLDKMKGRDDTVPGGQKHKRRKKSPLKP